MNVTNLKNDIDFLCGSTSATYADADKIRNMNVAYSDVARIIWESDGDWSFDDKNNTDEPIAYRTVANASGSYLVPTTALRINAVEIQNSSEEWQKLKPITYEDISVSPEQWLDQEGLPIYYRLDGNEIYLYPKPGTGDVTMASGMKVLLSRSVTELAVTASTATPGFADPFHRILSYAAAIDFEQDKGQREFLAMQRQRLQSGMTKFYNKRAEQFKTRIKPSSKRSWRQFI